MLHLISVGGGGGFSSGYNSGGGYSSGYSGSSASRSWTSSSSSYSPQVPYFPLDNMMLTFSSRRSSRLTSSWGWSSPWTSPSTSWGWPRTSRSRSRSPQIPGITHLVRRKGGGGGFNGGRVGGRAGKRGRRLLPPCLTVARSANGG